MDPVTAKLTLQGIELAAQLAIAWGSAEKVTTFAGGLIEKGLSLEQINEEMKTQVEKSRNEADAALRARGA